MDTDGDPIRIRSLTTYLQSSFCALRLLSLPSYLLRPSFPTSRLSLSTRHVDGFLGVLIRRVRRVRRGDRDQGWEAK